jgi:hypothetical protein
LILRQFDGILDELFVELLGLLIFRVVYATLEDAASMFMSGNFNAVV